MENSQEVLETLSKATAEERSQILSNDKYRNLVASVGSNVTIHDGKNALVIVRDDGDLGTLGGLSERTNPIEFYKMSREEKLKLLDEKDDVIMQNDEPVITKDLDVISKNNLRREVREELGNVGVYNLSLPIENAIKVGKVNLKDDDYIINRWNGKGIAYAINPQCYALKVDEELLDYIVNESQKGVREENSELLAIQKRPISELLKEKDKYHYPHEWNALKAVSAVIPPQKTNDR